MGVTDEHTRLRGSGKSYVFNVEVVFMERKFRQKLFIVARAKFLMVIDKSFDCDFMIRGFNK